MFHPVAQLDEQLLAFHRERMPKIDPDLPSIHFIGLDLIRRLHQTQRQAYVVDAATIHKYADDQGQLIQEAIQSPKIVDRKSLTYLSDRSLCEDYYWNKWDLPPAMKFQYRPASHRPTFWIAPLYCLDAVVVERDCFQA